MYNFVGTGHICTSKHISIKKKTTRSSHSNTTMEKVYSLVEIAFEQMVSNCKARPPMHFFKKRYKREQRTKKQAMFRPSSRHIVCVRRAASDLPG